MSDTTENFTRSSRRGAQKRAASPNIETSTFRGRQSKEKENQLNARKAKKVNNHLIAEREQANNNLNEAVLNLVTPTSSSSNQIQSSSSSSLSTSSSSIQIQSHSSSSNSSVLDEQSKDFSHLKPNEILEQMNKISKVGKFPGKSFTIDNVVKEYT
jgi:hypothetical protein